MTRLFLVAGARPNFMKIAPLYKRLVADPTFDVRIVHTGQHYDRAMSDVFFEELGLPEPHLSLNVGSGSHAAQTARVLERFEQALLDERPAAVVVVGDVNSTAACALAAAKVHYADGSRPVIAHVEAGLRSRDRSMPEEVNRVVTDALSDVWFTTEESAGENLRSEGADPARLHFVGNVMIDCLVDAWPRIEAREAWRALGLQAGSYGVVTLHRPSNVDRPAALTALVEQLGDIAREAPLVFPVHPRTRARMADAEIEPNDRLKFVEPLAYLDFLSLVSRARLVLTDSGGLQEETTFLGVPCLTLRDNTERPVTVTCGTNRLVGSCPGNLVELALAALKEPRREHRRPPLWDGKAADRIVHVLRDVVATDGASPIVAR